MVAANQQNDNLIVRHAETSDRRAILEVNRLAWETAYAHIYTPEEIFALFENTKRQRGSWILQRDRRIATLVATYQGLLIGFIGLGTLIKDKAGEVTTFYIHPDYQNKGIGKILWQYGLDILKKEDCPAVWVWVLAQAPARKFYEARGCIVKSHGTYAVGNHIETAIGYYLSIS